MFFVSLRLSKNFRKGKSVFQTSGQPRHPLQSFTPKSPKGDLVKGFSLLSGLENKGRSQNCKHMKHHFEAKIYKTGINWAVDVPLEITTQLKSEKGYIRIKGQINDFDFIQTLVPVKNSPYRLFVNFIMMKGGKTALGEIATFTIEQNEIELIKMYPMPELLSTMLTKEDLNESFNALSEARKKDILKYLSFIKTEETMMKNIIKLISKLKNKEKDVRIP